VLPAAIDRLGSYVDQQTAPAFPEKAGVGGSIPSLANTLFQRSTIDLMALHFHQHFKRNLILVKGSVYLCLFPSELVLSSSS
jgi:hypothetical protein